MLPKRPKTIVPDTVCVCACGVRSSTSSFLVFKTYEQPLTTKPSLRVAAIQAPAVGFDFKCLPHALALATGVKWIYGTHTHNNNNNEIPHYIMNSLAAGVR